MRKTNIAILHKLQSKWTKIIYKQLRAIQNNAWIFFSKQSLNLYTLLTLQALTKTFFKFFDFQFHGVLRAYKSILQNINRFSFQNIKDITEISIASENDDFTLFLGVFLPKKRVQNQVKIVDAYKHQRVTLIDHMTCTQRMVMGLSCWKKNHDLPNKGFKNIAAKIQYF